MNPARWKQVRDLFDVVVELPAAERSAYLHRAAPGDADLRNEVVSLLASYDDSSAGRNLEEPVLRLGNMIGGDPSQTMSGRQIGPYQLARRIGSGGMGTVYVASRADKQYTRIVAIKLIRRGLGSEGILQRFLTERQVLASLDHPNIARLYDGGTTPEGLPYLVMEYIEGTSIDKYCDHQRLTTAGRLRIFLAVCDAVQYAHRNLVVHRDLKPGNILVTTEGVPKLLDFGIAKVLRPEFSQQGVAAPPAQAEPMTIEYASPEQVRGEPITTASDVYSLGVLLYELLTGRRPHRFKGTTAAAVIEAICNVEPPRPSEAVLETDAGQPDRRVSLSATRDATPEKLARRLRGDLDVIVLTALRKEPQRRYVSVESLGDDIRRHLQGLPVRARGDEVGYRAGKFVTRHTAPVAATVLVATALLASTIVSLHYARAARNEKEIAEHRFEETRRLARFVLFELDDAMRAGGTAARSIVVPKALEYLNRISREAAGDVSLQRELVEGYLKMGDIQGNLYGPHLGDRAGALSSYRRAREIAEALAKARPEDPRSATDLARASVRLGDLAALGGDRKEALDAYGRVLRVLESDPRKNRKELIEISRKIGFVHFQIGDLRSALERYTRALGLAEQWQTESPGDVEARKAVALATERSGEMMAQLGQGAAGLEKLDRAVSFYEELLSARPDGTGERRDVLAASLIRGDVLAGLARPADAIESYRRATKLAESLAWEDPQNNQYQRDLHVALGRLADALPRAGKTAESKEATEKALKVLRPLVDQKDPSEYDLQQYVWLLVTTPHAELRNPRSALPYARRAVAQTRSSDPRILDLLARAYHGAGDIALAIATGEQALALLPAAEPASELRKELEENLARYRKSAASAAK